MMANLVLAVITIKTAVSAQMSYAKATLGGTVAIQADMSAIRELQQSEIENGGDRKQLFKEMLRPAVDIKTADEIAAYSEYVKDYSYEISSSANAGDLETVESSSGIPDRRGFPGGNSADSATLGADLAISGINA